MYMALGNSEMNKGSEAEGVDCDSIEEEHELWLIRKEERRC